MTETRQRYLRVGSVVAGGFSLAIIAVALVEYFGRDFLTGRLEDGGTAPAMTANAPSKPVGHAGKMSLLDPPQPIFNLQFKDSAGRPLTLADFRGKVVLLNIWATWCGPCREEMPTLDRLQSQLGGPDFEVVALSIDRADVGIVRKFYDEVDVKHLGKYIDESGKASRKLNTVGLPTTLLIDREGREVARRVGPAEWDTPEMVEFSENNSAKSPER